MTQPTPPRIAIPMPTSADGEYNRQSWPAYAEAIRLAGGVPVEVELGQAGRRLSGLLQGCHGVLLPGSPADVNPERYGQERLDATAPADIAREQIDLQLLEHVQKTQMPLFSICFGTQMLNVCMGGTLIQDLSVMPVNHKAGRSVAVAHTAAIVPESMLGAVVATQAEATAQDGLLRLPVNSSHHQALAIPGEGLRVVARCPQDAVIEAIEGGGPEHFVLGVQWHPERSFSVSAASRRLFARFVGEAAAWAASAP